MILGKAIIRILSVQNGYIVYERGYCSAGKRRWKPVAVFNNPKQLSDFVFSFYTEENPLDKGKQFMDKTVKQDD